MLISRSRGTCLIGLIIDQAQVTRQVHLLALAATTFTTRGKPDTQHAATQIWMRACRLLSPFGAQTRKLMKFNEKPSDRKPNQMDMDIAWSQEWMAPPDNQGAATDNFVAYIAVVSVSSPSKDLFSPMSAFHINYHRMQSLPSVFVTKYLACPQSTSFPFQVERRRACGVTKKGTTDDTNTLNENLGYFRTMRRFQCTKNSAWTIKMNGGKV